MKSSLSILRLYGILLLTAICQSITYNATAQVKNTGAADAMTQMLDYSRPGANHQLFQALTGTWNFKDAKLSFVKGTLTRTPIYDGRFYQVETTGGKLKLPVANGEMKEDNYKSMQLEGYNNASKLFEAISINNHIGSDIQMQTGSYNAGDKAFTYVWDSELIPGEKKKNQRVLKIIDATHYIEEFYEQRNGSFVKTRELDYEKVANR